MEALGRYYKTGPHRPRGRLFRYGCQRSAMAMGTRLRRTSGCVAPWRCALQPAIDRWPIERIGQAYSGDDEPHTETTANRAARRTLHTPRSGPNALPERL